ncbi:hypothetical protein Anas_01593 [Armadillidium nasatum]|uniref:Uncharacterized protein n=1 Tax=Armadillidium nasatum TaxID=96803 RepID=A0A5N5T7Z4_9CRUS|nr:hypothetical protein Anas_01593 [Armadillidium nasatum]
MFYMCRRDCS